MIIILTSTSNLYRSTGRPRLSSVMITARSLLPVLPAGSAERAALRICASNPGGGAEIQHKHRSRGTEWSTVQRGAADAALKESERLENTGVHIFGVNRPGTRAGHRRGAGKFAQVKPHGKPGDPRGRDCPRM